MADNGQPQRNGNGGIINGTNGVKAHLIERVVVWSALMLVLVLIGMVGTLVAILLWANPQGMTEIIKPMIEGRIISRTIVLFLIIPAVSGLALLDKIDGATAASVLSAIAGYVLGSSSTAP